MGVLHRRGIIAAAAVVAFNVLMFVLAALGPSRWRLPSWSRGSRAMLSCPWQPWRSPNARSRNQPGLQIHPRTLEHHCGTSPDGLGRAV